MDTIMKHAFHAARSRGVWDEPEKQDFYTAVNAWDITIRPADAPPPPLRVTVAIDCSVSTRAGRGLMWAYMLKSWLVYTELGVAWHGVSLPDYEMGVERGVLYDNGLWDAILCDAPYSDLASLVAMAAYQEPHLTILLSDGINLTSDSVFQETVATGLLGHVHLVVPCVLQTQQASKARLQMLVPSGVEFSNYVTEYRFAYETLN